MAGSSNDRDDRAELGRLDRIERDLDEIKVMLSEFDDKFNAVLAQWTHERGDLTGEVDEIHRSVASDLESFVSQKLQPLAYLGTPKLKQGGYSTRQVADLLSKLCVCYLGPSEIDLRRVRRTLKARKGDHLWIASGKAAVQASKILRDIKYRGIEFTWDYEFDHGFPIDDTRQRAWSNCDPSGDIRFVVIPGYHADGECYLRQQVFTESLVEEERA